MAMTPEEEEALYRKKFRDEMGGGSGFTPAPAHQVGGPTPGGSAPAASGPSSMYNPSLHTPSAGGDSSWFKDSSAAGFGKPVSAGNPHMDYSPSVSVMNYQANKLPAPTPSNPSEALGLKQAQTAATADYWKTKAATSAAKAASAESQLPKGPDPSHMAPGGGGGKSFGAYGPDVGAPPGSSPMPAKTMDWEGNPINKPAMPPSSAPVQTLDWEGNPVAKPSHVAGKHLLDWDGNHIEGSEAWFNPQPKSAAPPGYTPKPAAPAAPAAPAWAAPSTPTMGQQFAKGGYGSAGYSPTEFAPIKLGGGFGLGGSDDEVAKSATSKAKTKKTAKK